MSCGIENPKRSKLFWMPLLQDLFRTGRALYSWLASCAYGSAHKKEFAFASCFLDFLKIHKKCPRGHSHVPLHGASTKLSAVYHDNVAAAIASVYSEALRASCAVSDSERGGLESVAVNEVLASSHRRPTSVWRWRKKKHINVLESEASYALYKQLALDGGERRFSVITDSSVVLGSHAKGRTSAKLLKPSLRKCGALIGAAGLYPGVLFGPTRLNVSDDPTSGRPCRPAFPRL